MSDSSPKAHSKEQSNSPQVTFLHIVPPSPNGDSAVVSLEDQHKYHEDGIASEDIIERKQLNFQSVSKYYELLKTYGQSIETKSSFPFANLTKPDHHAPSACFCFCGRKLCEMRYLVRHWEYMHGTYFETLEYMVAYASWTKSGMHSKMFIQEKQEYLSQIRDTPYQLLTIPEDLKFIVPLEIRQQINQSMRILTSHNIDDNNFYFTTFQAKLNYRRTHLYSQEFMETVRQLIIKYFTVFDRSILAFLHNMTIKDTVILLIINLTQGFNQLKNGQKRKKSKQVDKLAKLIEIIGRHFLLWVDLNYKKVFESNNIYYQHIELEGQEKYSDTQRLWNLDLIVSNYLGFLLKNNIGKENFLIAKFLMTSLQKFCLYVEEDQNLVIVMNSKKRKGQ